MLVGPTQFEQLYEGALRDDLASSEDKKLLVFVSTGEADSVCATRILQTICRAHAVYFTIYPVSSYGEMQEICRQEFSETETARTVMLLNCGACEDARQLLELPQNVRAIVIDSHRPIHHSYNNVADIDTLFLHDPADGTVTDDIPAASDSESDTDSGDEDDSEESGDENEPPQRRQRMADGSAPKLTAKQQQRADREQRRKQRIEYYERGSYWGRPVSGLLFDLAHALHLDDNRLLWLHIVGVTDQWVHQHVARERYLQATMHLETLVANNADQDAEEETQVMDPVTGQSTTIRLPKHFQIKAIDDLRLGLLRHWSVHEALNNSPYVAVRKMTWLDKGRKDIEDLLVVCGLPLHQAKLTYSNMAPKFRRTLAAKLAANAPHFGIPEVAFRSFELQHGWNRATYLSASDVVAGITALLEGSASPADADTTVRERFWRAWAALGEREINTLRLGLDMAKKLQAAIVQDGGMMIQRNLRIVMRQHVLFNLTTADIANRDLMAQPLALMKLAAFLHEAHFQREKRLKPVVVFGPADTDARCLVVGFSGQPRLSSGQGSRFGNAFEKAAQASNASARHDRFDASIIEIAVSDIRRFTAELTNAARAGAYG